LYNIIKEKEKGILMTLVVKDFELDKFTPYLRHIAAIANNLEQVDDIAYGMAIVLKEQLSCGQEFIDSFVAEAETYFIDKNFTDEDIVF
jgi:patatin-like phospholipase/acyl hydrolase